MQQYWQRICREIENGTYKRHKLRAEKAFGNVLDNPMLAREASSEERPRHEQDENELAALYDDNSDTDDALRAALAAADEAQSRTATTEASKGKGLLAQLKKRDEPEAARTSPSPKVAGSELKRPSVPPIAAEKSGTGVPVPPPRPSGPPPRPSVGPPGPPPRTSTGPRPELPPLPQRTPTGPRPDLPPLPPRTATGPRPDLPPLPPRTATGARAEAPRATATEPVAPARPTESGAASLSEERIRALHRDYVDARAKTNATPVSFEKLAQNLRETEKKLRTEHAGKNVDFEVVVKDGKAILKPKLR
jgi:hypothetical protein